MKGQEIMQYIEESVVRIKTIGGQPDKIYIDYSLREPLREYLKELYKFSSDIEKIFKSEITHCHGFAVEWIDLKNSYTLKGSRLFLVQVTMEFDV